MLTFHAIHIDSTKIARVNEVLGKTSAVFLISFSTKGVKDLTLRFDHMSEVLSAVLI